METEILNIFEPKRDPKYKGLLGRQSYKWIKND